MTLLTFFFFISSLGFLGSPKNVKTRQQVQLCNGDQDQDLSEWTCVFYCGGVFHVLSSTIELTQDLCRPSVITTNPNPSLACRTWLLRYIEISSSIWSIRQRGLGWNPSLLHRVTVRSTQLPSTSMQHRVQRKVRPPCDLISLQGCEASCGIKALSFF